MDKHWGSVLLAGLVLGAISIGPADSATQASSTSQAGQGQGQNQPAPSGQSSGAQSGQAGAAATPAKPQITPDEFKAYNAIQHEIDASRQAQLVDEFVKKYPSSPLVSDVYFFGAYAWQQQNNLDKVVEYGNKSLQANPNNFRSLLLMAEMLPQPQEMKGSDADKEKKLADAEADANKALQAIGDLKPPNMPPEQLTQLKAGLTAQVHSSLGMVHLQKATMGLTGTDPQELGKAEEEYKASVTGVDKPSPEDYFRLGEVYRMENKVDDAIQAFNQASKLSQGSPLQAMADQQADALKKQKAQAPPPAKP
ncbi:MAG TPA: hypothetical protein VI455_16330 [Terriglobia bacterium]